MSDLPSTMERLGGRRALVTGAAGHGIGRAIATRLASEGATVVVSDSHRERTAAVGGELRLSHKGQIEEVVLDVTNAAAIDRATDAIGPVDILVNNAGIGLMAPFSDLDDAAWDAVLAVNLRGPVALIRALAPSMVDRRSGSIVNVSSVASWSGRSGEAAYAASKAALSSLTRTLATELGPAGVRCNGVAPGIVLTPFTRRHADEYESERLRTPLGRFGDPTEVAAAVAFLASDDASYITGETLCVSGGWYLRP